MAPYQPANQWLRNLLHQSHLLYNSVYIYKIKHRLPTSLLPELPYTPLTQVLRLNTRPGRAWEPPTRLCPTRRKCKQKHDFSRGIESKRGFICFPNTRILIGVWAGVGMVGVSGGRGWAGSSRVLLIPNTCLSPRPPCPLLQTQCCNMSCRGLARPLCRLERHGGITYKHLTPDMMIYYQYIHEYWQGLVLFISRSKSDHFIHS